MKTSAPVACPGPLIWYETDMPCPCDTRGRHLAAILHCAACGYIVCSGGYNDEQHADTDVLREGLAQ